MLKRSYLFALVPMLLHVGTAGAQESYPIMGKIAEKVIAKIPELFLPAVGPREKPATGQGKGADGATGGASAA